MAIRVGKYPQYPCDCVGNYLLITCVKTHGYCGYLPTRIVMYYHVMVLKLHVYVYIYIYICCFNVLLLSSNY